MTILVFCNNMTKKYLRYVMRSLRHDFYTALYIFPRLFIARRTAIDFCWIYK